MYNVASSQQNVRLRATASQNLRAQRQYISDESAAYYLTTVGRPWQWPLATSNPSILFAWRPRAKNARDTQRTSTYYFCQICQNFQTAICDYFLEFWKDHESEYGVGTRDAWNVPLRWNVPTLGTFHFTKSAVPPSWNGTFHPKTIKTEACLCII